MSGSVSLSNGLPLAVIGERVRAERVALGLSLEDVAERSGVSRSMVSEIERGRKVPTIVVLDRVTAALGSSLTALVQPVETTQVVVLRRNDQQVAEIRQGGIGESCRRCFPTSTSSSCARRSAVVSTRGPGFPMGPGVGNTWPWTQER